MHIQSLHPWNVSPQEAIALQKDLRQRVRIENAFSTVKIVAGCDMAIDVLKNEGVAGIVVFTWPELRVIERQSAVLPLEFPYVPGLLSFREIPVLTKAFEKLKNDPDLLFVDGQGIAHPRGMGIASHLGLLLDKPAIGCGKSLLYGKFSEPGPEMNDSETLFSREGETIGAVLRTKPKCNPLFISPGHRIGVETSLRFVQEALRGYRLPEPTRQADAYVAAVKRGSLQKEADLF